MKLWVTFNVSQLDHIPRCHFLSDAHLHGGRDYRIDGFILDFGDCWP